jgi:hypothetical protein
MYSFYGLPFPLWGKNRGVNRGKKKAVRQLADSLLIDIFITIA